MKKLLALLVAILIIGSLSIPAFAAESGFVPSITYKPDPEVVPVEDPEGEERFAVIRDEDGEIIDYVDYGCIDVTPIAHVWDEEMEVPAEIEELLLFVYGALNDGSMEIPHDKHEADLDPANMVIRDLFDARWTCEEHADMLDPEGVVMDITFDLGVVADAEIFVMTYDEETGEWSPIVKTVNNGDGTVTCTFEHLCAIEFSMPLVAAATPAPAPATPSAMIWIVLLALAAVAVVALLIAKNKKKETVKN